MKKENLRNELLGIRKFFDEAMDAVTDALSEIKDFSEINSDEFLEVCEYWAYHSGINVDDPYAWLKRCGIVSFEEPIASGKSDVYQFVGWFLARDARLIVNALRETLKEEEKNNG